MEIQSKFDVIKDPPSKKYMIIITEKKPRIKLYKRSNYGK